MDNLRVQLVQDLLARIELINDWLKLRRGRLEIEIQPLKLSHSSCHILDLLLDGSEGIGGRLLLLP